MNGVLENPPEDPIATGCNGYLYNFYSAGSNGCDASKGDYYVLAVVDMELSPNPHPDSPGFSCSGLDWQASYDWVTGKFVNE